MVGAPELFDRYGRPEHPNDLTRYPAIVFSHVAGHQDWHFHHPEHGECVVHVSGPVRMNHGIAVIPMLLEGIGVTAQPEFYIWQELRDGRLEEVLKDWTVSPIPVSVVTPPGRARPARVRVLIEFLRDHFSKQPWAIGIET